MEQWSSKHLTTWNIGMTPATTTTIAAAAAAAAAPQSKNLIRKRAITEGEKTLDCEKFFLTVNNTNSIHVQVELLANEPEVNVVDSQDLLLLLRLCAVQECAKVVNSRIFFSSLDHWILPRNTASRL